MTLGHKGIPFRSCLVDVPQRSGSDPIRLHLTDRPSSDVE